MLSAPRAGRPAGQGRGRGHLRGIQRAGSPQANVHIKQRSTSPNPRGGQHGSAGRSRGNIGRGRATTRGRGNAVWTRGGARGAFGGTNTAIKDTRTADQRLQATFTFTGDRAWRAPENAAHKDYKANIKNLWETLKRNRVVERQNAIREGKISDPDKKLKLSEAIKSIGTCEEMCPEWERITRIYDGNVLAPEKIQLDSGITVPCEERMVKRFQRSAAGDDEQLPSDLRPPRVLRKSLEYMLDRVLNEATSIENVQDFLWDRSRAIRNDFSIQQVTGVEDVKIAIECFERIARYHITALHLTSHPNHSPRVEHKQENEQLTNALTSLFQYYEDNRGKLDCPNEPEFRAYYILREIDQERRPDLESRVQQWPSRIVRHPRVKVALKLYAAASDVAAALGPLDPKKAVAIAQANAMRFWTIIGSPAVPYLMACCVETYFRVVRDTALTIIWRASRRPSKTKLDDILLSDLTDMLGFDNEDQTQQYCERQGFTIGEREDGNSFLDLTSISASQHELPGSDSGANQTFSERLVEDKRHGRLPAAVIKGLSFSEARSQGLLEESADVDMDAESSVNPVSTITPAPAMASDAVPSPASRGLFGQPTTTNFGFQGPGPSNSPFAANPFGLPVPSNANDQAPKATGIQASSIDGQSIFARPAQAALPPFSSGSQPPSNQQIAANVFSTPSFTLTPTKVGDGVAIQSQEIGSAQKPTNPFQFGTTSNPFTKNADKWTEANKSAAFPENPFAVHATQTTSTPVATATGTNKNEKSAGSPGAVVDSSLGSSIFTKKGGDDTATSDSVFGTRPENLTKHADLTKPESPSLFIPLKSPEGSSTDETTQGGAASAAQIFPPAPAAIKFQPVQSILNPPTNQASKPGFSQDVTQNPFAKGFSPATNPMKGVASPPEAKATPSLFDAKPSSNSSQTMTRSKSDTVDSNKPTVDFQTTSMTQPPGPFKRLFSADTSTNFTPNQAVPPSNLPVTESTANSSLLTAPLAETQSPKAQAPTQSKTPLTKVQAAVSAKPAPILKPQQPSDEEYIDRLIRAFALGPNGIINQFIENEVAETVRGCIKKINRERERAEVKLARRFLLSCKYMRRWKDIAWTRKLQREAKQRRQDFRKSLHDMALSSKNSSRAPSEDIMQETNHVFVPPKQAPRSSMAPPKSILKNGLSAHTAERPQPRKSTIFGGTVDKFKDKIILRPPQRSNTMKISSAPMNASRISNSRSSHHRGLSASMIGEHGLLHDQLMRRASRLVDGRTDTTRTDYFKLLSLGIDPNTPVIPASRKRRNDEEIEAEARKSRMSPSKPGSSSSSAPVLANGLAIPARRPSLQLADMQESKPIKDDDDDLFAQIRAVKKAMSETETWYREYREQSEKTSVELANETEKQRKLREWRPSVSRTEARWKRDGLPSFLRSSWTPRETVSTERAESQQRDMDVKKEKTNQEEDAETEEDDQMYDEEEEPYEGQEEYDEEEEEGEEECYEGEEEDYDEDHDTQAFGAYGQGAVMNPASAFAAKGASVEDAIEL